MKHTVGKGTELRKSDSAHHANTDKYDSASMLSHVDQTSCHPEHESGSAQSRVVDAGYVPEGGDVVWIDFMPQAGHEQTSKRPTATISREL